MKQSLCFFLILCLTMSLLAGCAASGANGSTSTPTQEIATTAQTIAPETTVPEATVLETAAAQASAPADTIPDTQAAETDYTPEITPVITTQQTQVRVSTADEFLAAIAPDTEIILDAELLDLSTATGYGTKSTSYYYWYDEFDGPALYITGLTNLTIRGGGADRTANTISAAPRYANVLNFENCANIMVTGFTAGHAEQPGSCIGGVLRFLNSQDILVQDCGLFGCGTLGVIGESSKSMQIVYNDIYDCSVGGVEFSNCEDVNVDCNTFRNLGGSEFRVYGCENITCNGEPVHDFSPRNLT